MQLDENRRQKALQQAEILASDFDPEEAEAFAEKHKNASWFKQFKLLYDMVTDKSFQVSPKTYVTIAGALAYVVLPVDVIPDFIPGVGFIDDAFVLGFVIKSLHDEIERYKAFKGIV